jgi:hypothetical protein
MNITPEEALGNAHRTMSLTAHVVVLFEFREYASATPQNPPGFIRSKEANVFTAKDRNPCRLIPWRVDYYAGQ